MNVQEENNQKLLRLNVEIRKFSLKVLIKFFKNAKSKIKYSIDNNKTNYKLKDLVKKERNLTKIDLANLKDEDLKDFHLIAKKCGLKYSLVKDTENNIYTFFFNAKSAEMYNYVAKELEKKLNERMRFSNLKEQIEKDKMMSKDQINFKDINLENKSPKITR